MHQPINSKTYQLTTSQAHNLINSSPQTHTNSKTHANSNTHELIKSSTQKQSTHNLKILNFILQSYSKLFSVLAGI